MLRRSVIALFVVGVVASIASVPQQPQEYGFTSSLGANPLVVPIALDPSQRRVRLRVTLDRADVEFDGTAHLGLDVTARFDEVANTVPARVRAGLLAPAGC